jgi:hypothetical protein
MRIGWKDKDGIVHVEDVDEDEYNRIISGEGSSRKDDPVDPDSIKAIRKSVDRLLPN